MKRLLDEADASLEGLRDLVQSANVHQSSPFAKRAIESRIRAALTARASRRRPLLRPGLLGAGALLVAATAAAAGYSYLAPEKPTLPVAPPAAVVEPPRLRTPTAVRTARVEATSAPRTEPQPSSSPSVKRVLEKPVGEDPSQVAEAVRALRKQGDAGRAQVLLDQYLRANPRGALAEDALALSIEAAAARKDPRASEYARRYLARYPNGRFRALAERAIVR